MRNKENDSKTNSAYHQKHKDDIKERKRLWYLANKKDSKAKNKIWREENKDAINKYQRAFESNKYKTDPIYKVKTRLRKAIRKAFKINGFTKKSNTQDILGCTFEEFKQHLESKFESWMTWDNHGLYNKEINYGWDIDHIIPISRAKTEEDIIKLNHYTNLQPLCSYTNRVIKRAN